MTHLRVIKIVSQTKDEERVFSIPYEGSGCVDLGRESCESEKRKRAKIEEEEIST